MLEGKRVDTTACSEGFPSTQLLRVELGRQVEQPLFVTCLFLCSDVFRRGRGGDSVALLRGSVAI